MRSLDKILKLQPQRIYPGHGNIIEEPLGKIEYYIQHRNQREQQILQFFVDRPCQAWKAMDVVRVVYKETPEQLWPAAAYNVDHHLSKLNKEGKLQVSEQDDEKIYTYQATSAL